MKVIKTTSILLLFFLLNCTKEEINTDFIQINNSEEYTYDLKISGDEEGASILTQALHFEKSELIRNSSTNFNIVYKYKANSNYVGTDFVEIVTCTLGPGNNGIACNKRDTIRIDFNISN